MRRIVVGALIVLVAVGTAGAQQRRIFNNGEIDFAPSAARFRLTADELESNLDEINYTVNGGDVMVYSEPVRLSEEGRHVIAYRATDITGNVSSERVYTVFIDDTAPTLAATAKGAAFVEDGVAYLRGDTAIVVSAGDGASGVQGIFVSLDGDNYLRYTDVAFVNEEGEHRGYAYAIDNVGNRSRTFSLRAFVDNSAPTVRIVPRQPLTAVQGDRYTARGNEFIVRATDEISGVERIEVSINRQEFITYSGPVSFNESGLQTLRARAVDRLGNTSNVTEVTFYVDTQTPQPRIEALID